MAEEKIKKNPVQDSADQVEDRKSLILYNDDEHTFEYVIDALIEICGHEYIQASQCASITHYNGRCDVKRGDFSGLKVMKDALVVRELSVTIE